jgi:hypothetical protein
MMGREWFDDMIAKMDSSVFSLTIWEHPTEEMCLQVGAAVCLDKPLILLAPFGTPIPNNLKRIANVIVEGSMDDPTLQARLTEAINHVMATDARCKKSHRA